MVLINLPSSAGDAMVCDSKHPSLRIKESELDATELRHSAGLVNIGFSCVKGETAVCYMPLLWAQCFPGVREIWQNYHHDESDENRKSAFDDVQLRIISLRTVVEEQTSGLGVYIPIARP